MSEIMSQPINHAAEWSVLSHMMRKPEIIGEVIGTKLEVKDFSEADTRLLYTTIVELYYKTQTVDALVIGERVRDELAGYWGEPDNRAVPDKLMARLRQAMIGSSVLEHAEIVRQLSAKRQLMQVCFDVLNDVNGSVLTPEEIGDQMSARALQITSGGIKRAELLTWMDVGREYAKQLRRNMAAKQQGVEVGVYTGYSFFDDYTVGIQPGELCFLAGDPGVGKSAVAWRAGEGFAYRQLQRAEDKRVSTLVLSCEMGLYGSTQRVVQAITGLDGRRLREAAINDHEYRTILREWKNREHMPLIWNFASNFRLSQMRALIAEGIRRYNIGFVIIDHFRMIDTDRRYTNPNQEDEAKVRFLSEDIAKDLNVAVMCLAHSVKLGRNASEEGSRPRLSDLRGSGQIAAHATHVGFVYRPGKHMTDDARLEMGVSTSDAELIWAKNRWGDEKTAYFTFEPETMRVSAR